MNFCRHGTPLEKCCQTCQDETMDWSLKNSIGICFGCGKSDNLYPIQIYRTSSPYYQKFCSSCGDKIEKLIVDFIKENGILDYDLFRKELLQRIKSAPIEDGVTHLAESLLKRVIYQNSDAPDWFLLILGEYKLVYPSICASIIRCLGRLNYFNGGVEIMEVYIKHSDVEIRDAAIRALEHWGGEASIGVLREHHDSEKWLNDYVEQVIKDLEESEQNDIEAEILRKSS